MNIFNANLTQLVSQSLLEDEKAKQVCEVINIELQRLMTNINFAESAYDVDNATEAVLEHIAWQLNSELFFLGSTIEEKRQLVKETIQLHRRKGTKYAVEHAIQLIIPTAKVEEWFEYDLTKPYHFKVLNADRRTLKEILIIISLINIMKSLRSWLDNDFIAIDEALIDLNLLLDMDILMTSKHNLDYVTNTRFIYTNIYNEWEIEEPEEVRYVEHRYTTEEADELLNQFLTDNSLSRDSFVTLANQYKAQYDGTDSDPYAPTNYAIEMASADFQTVFQTWLGNGEDEEIKTQCNEYLTEVFTIDKLGNWGSYYFNHYNGVVTT